MAAGDGPCIDLDTHAWIVTGVVSVRLPVPATSRWRPYVSVGAGAIDAWVHDGGPGRGPYDAHQLDAVVDAGGGAMVQVNRWVGLRSDLRLRHAFAGRGGFYPEDYDFGRLSLGVTVGAPAAW